MVARLITGRSDRGVLDMVSPINGLSPLNRGLVADWRCVPGLMSGSRLVNLVRPGDKDGIHGTLTNGPTWSALTPPGGFGSLDFDGSDDYVHADTSHDFGNELTILASIRVVSYAGSAFGLIMAVDSNDPDNASIAIEAHGIGVTTGGVLTGFVNWDAGTSSSNRANPSGNTLSTGRWYRVALTVSAGGSATIYSDGVQTGSASFTNIGLHSPSRWRLGKLATDFFSAYWGGQIDSVRILDRCMSAGEIQLETQERHTLYNWIRRPVVFDVGGGGHAPLTANQGSYTLTGQNVNLYKGFYLLAAQGSYTLTGQTLNLIAYRLLALAQGSYSLTGHNANLLRGYPLTAVQGSYTLSGQEAGLIYSGAVAPLSANSGSYTVTGQTVNFLYNRIVGLAQGLYSLTGQTANVLYGRLITGVQGSYSLTGQTTNLYKDFYTPLSPGTYTLTGNTVSVLVRRLLALAQGTYTLTGQSVSFVVPSEDSHALYGSLRWSPLRYETMLIGNDNTIWLTGVRDSTAPTNADGTPDFIDDCTVTWNIKDAAYPNGSIQGQGTAVAVGSGGEYIIQVDDDILEVLTQNEPYWLNVTFTQPVTGFVGFISARFLVRVRTGRTVGT